MINFKMTCSYIMSDGMYLHSMFFIERERKGGKGYFPELQDVHVLYLNCRVTLLEPSAV
jgi:hypothetical protein